MDDLISNAWELMALGMGTVFVFLGLLVLATSLMSRALAGFPDAPPPVKSKPSRSPLPSSSIPASHRTAIELAIARHTRRS